jgi:hypothetical protein
VLSKATADLGLEQAGLAMEARGPVLVEDGPAKAMAMDAAVLAAPVALDWEDLVR